MAGPRGEAKPEPLRVDFDRRIKLEFHGARITSDGGLLAYGELDHALGLCWTWQRRHCRMVAEAGTPSIGCPGCCGSRYSDACRSWRHKGDL